MPASGQSRKFVLPPVSGEKPGSPVVRGSKTASLPVRRSVSVRGTVAGEGCAQLFERWCTHGDRRARDELVQRYLPLARKLAHRYRGAHEPIEDLFQVASIGLVKAVDRFDLNRGNAFSSFAVPTILGELKRYFRDCGWSVHVPRGAQEQALKVEEVQQVLTTRRGRPPTVPELAEYMELSVQDVLEALETAGAHHAASLDAPHTDEEGANGTLGSLFGAEDERYSLIEDGLTITAAAQQLPRQERRVLQLRFLEDLTQTQIAARIGVSQMQVSRVLRRAVERLNAFADPDGPAQNATPTTPS